MLDAGSGREAEEGDSIIRAKNGNGHERATPVSWTLRANGEGFATSACVLDVGVLERKLRTMRRPSLCQLTRSRAKRDMRRTSGRPPANSSRSR